MRTAKRAETQAEMRAGVRTALVTGGAQGIGLATAA